MRPRRRTSFSRWNVIVRLRMNPSLPVLRKIHLVPARRFWKSKRKSWNGTAKTNWKQTIIARRKPNAAPGQPIPLSASQAIPRFVPNRGAGL